MLEMAMERAKAWEQIEDVEHCGKLNMEQFHRLLIRAGWTVKEAEKAASLRGWERMCVGEVM